MQADTIIHVNQGVQGLDRYAYVNDNPINGTDPSGHCNIVGDMSGFTCPEEPEGELTGPVSSGGPGQAGNSDALTVDAEAEATSAESEPVSVGNTSTTTANENVVGEAETLAKNPGAPEGSESELDGAAKSYTTKDPYNRPSGFRKGVKDQVWENAKGIDGEVRDPLTGEVMNEDETWHMGHKPGYEFYKHHESAQDRGISRKEFLDEHNDPSHYRPELPSSNQSHRGEAGPDINYWIQER